MLRELRIKNFAVIDEVELALGPGLNVLTGETGAGKTIILNALGLVSGGRVSSDIIREGEEEAGVEALLDELPEPVRLKLREAGYRDDDELVIKRIVSRSGRNRVYVNGSLCPLAFLTELGEHLIHIYGQHSYQALLKPESHVMLLDAYGALEERVREMGVRFRSLAAAWSAVSEARELLGKRKREEESLRAQLEEIRRARLRSGEEEELKEKRNILVHAEKLYHGCKEGEEILYEGEDAVVGRLGRYVLRLREIANIDRSLGGAVELLDSSLAQLEEATLILRKHTSRLQFDPDALAKLEDRLAELSRLKRKYGGSVEDILALQGKLEEELGALERGAEEIPGLERAFEEARRSAWEGAEALSRERGRVARKFKKEMERELETLGLAGTTFEVRFLEARERGDDPPFLVGGKRVTETGMDHIEFYFSPNPGEPVKPLARIASGGEASRVMLAIKSLVLTKGDIPTLLFDEVDAGIGGRVAEIVGKKLKKVASSHQVICVTHLPQIAALSDSHFVVSKDVMKGRTFTEVRRLNEKERVGELARMLGGVKITEKARKHAEEMLRKREG